MDRETLDLLEFDRVLEIIENLAESSVGEKAIREFEPGTDLALIERRSGRIEEASRYISQKGRLSCGHLDDPVPILESLTADAYVLTTAELLSLLRFLRFLNEVRGELGEKDWPRLAGILGDMRVPGGVTRRLEQAIDDKGELRESAYPELKTARQRQQRLRKKVQGHLHRFESGSQAKYLIPEPYITQRAGRYVLPVRLEHQNSIPGIVHGTSSSGATVYLEPLSAVDLNNEYIYYRERESEIVHQILSELTEVARAHLEEMGSLLERLAVIDSTFACAEFSRRFRCSAADLSQGRHLKVIDGRHPLLIQTLGIDQVVPLTIELDQDKNILVVSGPNNGGKTVVLKTIGLLSAMAQAGLPVPASAASLPLFEDILADIGDHQSIIQHLSSFSSHIKRINRLLEGDSSPSLLLLDEVGRGTDPTYGAALAVALIEHFGERDSLLAATTHHREVRAYAASSARVRNASVQLDGATLKPTYVLEVGVSGSSSGLEIAAQLGLNKAILSRARDLLDKNELQVEDYLAELRGELRLLKEERVAVSSKLEELASRELALEQEARDQEKKRSDEFEARLKSWGSEFRSETARYLKKMKDRFAAAKTREELKRKEASLKEAFRRRVRSSKTEEADVVSGSNFQVGESVYHTLFKQRGTVAAVDQDDVLVEIGGKRVKSPAEMLKRIRSGEVTRKPSERVTLHVVEDSDPELNLIGMSADEASTTLDKYLDRAFVTGLQEVRVIHGFGTGKLKSAVRKLLDSHPQVDSYTTEGGATRVTLIH